MSVTILLLLPLVAAILAYWLPRIIPAAPSQRNTIANVILGAILLIYVLIVLGHRI